MNQKMLHMKTWKPIVLKYFSRESLSSPAPLCMCVCVWLGENNGKCHFPINLIYVQNSFLLSVYFSFCSILFRRYDSQENADKIKWKMWISNSQVFGKVNVFAFDSFPIKIQWSYEINADLQKKKSERERERTLRIRPFATKSTSNIVCMIRTYIL